MGKSSGTITGRKGRRFNDETMAKLRKANPITRPEVQGSTYRVFTVKPNAKVTSRPPLKEEIKFDFPNSEEVKRLAAQHVRQPKPHAEIFQLKTVITSTPKIEWSAEKRKAWKAHNKANPQHQIHF